MIDFSQVTDITLGSTPVEQVTDSQGNVLWSASVDPSAVYFYVEDVSGTANTLSIVKDNNNCPSILVFASTDQQTWVSIGTTDTPITATIPANSKLYLKATINSWGAYNTDSGNIIKCSNYFNTGGNIMSLLYGDNYQNQTTFPSNSVNNFYGLFKNDTHIVSAEDLILPATTLTENCYREMFVSCTSLTTAPALPATTLANSCYMNMFSFCPSLATAPTLPATTLAENCYWSLFYDCRALTTAPTLPATTLVSHCYYDMFSGCQSLNKITIYAQDISASDCLNGWLYDVSQTGDFYNLGGATYPSGTSGIPSGWTEHNSL